MKTDENSCMSLSQIELSLGLNYRKSCMKCGHNWILRKEKESVVCPKCHSPYWNGKREERVKK